MAHEHHQDHHHNDFESLICLNDTDLLRFALENEGTNTINNTTDESFWKTRVIGLFQGATTIEEIEAFKKKVGTDSLWKDYYISLLKPLQSSYPCHDLIFQLEYKRFDIVRLFLAAHEIKLCLSEQGESLLQDGNKNNINPNSKVPLWEAFYSSEHDALMYKCEDITHLVKVMIAEGRKQFEESIKDNEWKEIFRITKK